MVILCGFWKLCSVSSVSYYKARVWDRGRLGGLTGGVDRWWLGEDAWDGSYPAPPAPAVGSGVPPASWLAVPIGFRFPPAGFCLASFQSTERTREPFTCYEVLGYKYNRPNWTHVYRKVHFLGGSGLFAGISAGIQWGLRLDPATRTRCGWTWEALYFSLSSPGLSFPQHRPESSGPCSGWPTWLPTPMFLILQSKCLERETIFSLFQKILELWEELLSDCRRWWFSW